MPPRYAYWTIILDGVPTAFRARERETLVPTLRQLQSRNPDAVLKWFARGKLWDSPEQAHLAARMAREAEGPKRDRDWRPGGRHADPRLERERERKAKRAARKAERRPPVAAGSSSPVAQGFSPANRKHRRPQTRDPRAEKSVGRAFRPAGKKPPVGRAFRPGKARHPRAEHPETPADQPAFPVPAPQPPPPPGPDRPPKPSENPPPDEPAPPETITIIPEPPERARNEEP